MRIAYLTHQYFPRHVGGTEVYTRGLARRAREAGHEVRVLTGYDSSSAAPTAFHGIHRSKQDEIPLVEFHYNLGAAPDPARYEYENPLLAALVEEDLYHFRPDIVHITHAMKLSAACLNICNDRNIPFVVTLCDFWFICPRHTLMTWDGNLCEGPSDPEACVRCLHHTHGFPDTEKVQRFVSQRHPFLREVLLKARRIIALSDFQKKMFVRNGYPAERIETLSHGLETAGLDPSRKNQSDKPKVVFIGNLAEHKGAHVLLEALSQIKDLPLECLVYGSLAENDAYGTRLKNMAALDPRIRLMGTFAPEDLGKVLEQASVLALPAQWYENAPLVVKAALYMGIPVLVSNLGSLAEMVQQGPQGMLLPPADAHAWARGLREILVHPRMRNLRGEKIKTMDEHATEVFDIYRNEVEKIHAEAC